MASSELPKEINNSLKDFIEQTLLSKQCDLKFSKGTSKGDNYLGIITKVKVTEKEVEDNNNPRTLNLLLKSASQAEEFRQYIKIEILYEREVFMYEKVFPELKRLQEKLGLQDIFYPVPECYKTSVVVPYEYLLLEDMNVKGYQMRDRKHFTDLNHSKQVLKTYGKYHALCLALKAKEPEIYNHLSKQAREIYFANVNLKNLCNTIKAVIDKVNQRLDQDNDKMLIDKLTNFINFPVDGLLDTLSIEPTDGKAVFCHGDSWINNILFKYEDKSSNPSDVCILDWQLSRCASPALDISYFIFSCTDKRLRDSHYDELLNVYYSSLSSFLEQLECPADLFTKNDLMNHMERFSKYGLMMCFITVPLISANLDEIPDWTNNMNEEDRAKMFTQERENDVHIMSRLIDIVRDCDRLKYL